jgi:putative molybdopterin biosynthesis protein
VVGIPGYPVSAIIAMEQFILPLLAQMQGIHLPGRTTIQAILAKDLPSPSGIEEFRRMIVGRISGEFIAVPLKKGAGAITTLTRANGMLRINPSLRR